MENTLEIPRQDWLVYFEGLGQRALRHPVRIEVEGPDLGAQTLAELPLLGIELEKKGSRQGDIELSLGDGRQQFVHSIQDVAHVYVKLDEEGDLECLSLQDGAGGNTLVFFEGEDGVGAWAGHGAARTDAPAPGP